MRNHFSKLAYAAALGLTLALTFGCTTTIEPPPPPPEYSLSSTATSASWCSYNGDCFPVAAETCAAIGGQIAESCPANASSSSLPSSSSAQNTVSSSSTEEVYSSSAVKTDGSVLCSYSGGCSIVATETCAILGGQQVKNCPAASSSSGGVSPPPASSSSSSNVSQQPIVSSSSGSQGSGQVEGNVFTDQRDGNKYKFEIASNGRVWMSENLNYSRNNTLGYCYGVDINGANPYRDSTSCGNGYGRIYEWSVAMDGNGPQGLCPNGWHVPSTAEWNPIVGTETRKMSNNFYIYPGNYNLNAKYPPVGWKERGESGFYWTSSGNSYFTGFWDATLCKNENDCIVEAGTGASATDKFSVRCIANDDFGLSCGTGSYIPATQFCSGNAIYAKCGGKEYKPATEFCSGTAVYPFCDGKTYNPAAEFCSSGTIYAKCGGKEYNPAFYECVDGALKFISSANYQITCTDERYLDYCRKTVTLALGECVEINVLGYTNQYDLPKVLMRCDVQGTQGAVSVTLALNGKAQSYTGSYAVRPEIGLGTIKLGDNKFGTLCVTALSGASGVRCNGPDQ